MNRNLLDKTSYAKVPLQPGAMKQVIAANGNHVQVLGKLSITLHVGNKKFTKTVHVLDQLHHSLILGVDFMRKNGAFINFQDCTLELKDNPSIVLSSITLNSGLLRTKKVVTIPKHSETLIQVSVSKQDEDSTVLLEPLDAPPQFLQNVVVTKCLVKIRNGKAHLRLLNLTATDIKLRPHKVIAKVSHVNTEEIHSIDDKQSAETPSFSSTSKSESDAMTFDLTSACLTSIEKQKNGN
ncbi:unnamed protein product [Mytilus coruscus]|uniref:Uncharacterized protein n=1 Tax=Mytilus coruscus TaxID=42192 RepID=A0A6J8B8R9_MYTCO|nr:unnamed protein product [Mytilus coruscus]